MLINFMLLKIEFIYKYKHHIPPPTKPFSQNYFLFTALVAAINRQGPKKVLLKFFEPGHTFMSADSFHAKVEKKMRGRHVEDFPEYEAVIDSCGINCPMKATDFQVP